MSCQSFARSATSAGGSIGRGEPVPTRGAPRRAGRVLPAGRGPPPVGPGDGPPLDEHAAVVGRREPAEHAEERGLAAPGRTDGRAELAHADTERDVLEGLDGPRACRVTLADALDRDQRRGRAHENPRISRAITRRWISDVPSPISVSFASRKMRSTGNSAMYPAPPWICTAWVAAFIAVSEAKSLAIAAACIAGRPWSLSHAARRVSRRATSTSVTRSASIPCRPLNSASVLPNALRCFMYRTA